MTRKVPDEPGGWRYALRAADAAPRCGALRKANGEPCRAPAMRNGRCHKHGGASTGPRTPDGLERCRRAPWKHGGREQHARDAARRRAQAALIVRALRNEVVTEDIG